MTTTSIKDIKTTPDIRVGLSDTLIKQQLLRLLSGLPKGRLIIEDDEIVSFGEAPDVAAITAKIVINRRAAYRYLLLGGSIGAGESYMQGDWSSPDLLALMRLMAANIEFINGIHGSRLMLQRLAEKFWHWLNRNTRRRARQNISAHYDLSNDFFALFLDTNMMYSAAVFPTAESGLEEASRHKVDLICRRLQLKETDHLLEIGTGWGGLAIHAAKKYGCRVTTTTISEQQFEYARQRVREEGLEQRVVVLLQDYRELDGRYDKLVSIEMIEAVGYQYYQQYFTTCADLLKPDGLMLLQTITIPGQRYQAARKSTDFIQRYIFPGGCLPSHQAISAELTHATDMQMVHMQEIGEHYARTLRLWRERFQERLQQVKQLGFNDTFIRMWEFYLCYCEGGFQERAIGTAQYLFAKPEWRSVNPE